MVPYFPSSFIMGWTALNPNLGASAISLDVFSIDLTSFPQPQDLLTRDEKLVIVSVEIKKTLKNCCQLKDNRQCSKYAVGGSYLLAQLNPGADLSCPDSVDENL